MLDRLFSQETMLFTIPALVGTGVFLLRMSLMALGGFGADDGASAEDIVQEAFLWVWNSPDRIDPNRGSVESLLMTVVHRRSIDALRARSRRDALRGPMDIDAVDEKASDLFDSVAQSLTHERVRECVTGLSDDQRQVIEMAYFSGLTHREISEETGVPIGTVKSRLRLGMVKLRTAFGIGGIGGAS